jgi:small subunit ribosomal protein S27e
MKKERILIPKPRSKFLLVQCTNCGNEQIVFSSINKDLKCKACDGLIVEKSGGKSKIHGIVRKRMD